MRLLVVTIFFVGLVAGCSHSYYYSTGLPADVADRFFFHLEGEARDRGLQTSRSETDLHVYAQGGQLWYQVQSDEITTTIVISNRKNATSNYYKSKREEFEKLNGELVAGARRRARQAKDFAY